MTTGRSPGKGFLDPIDLPEDEKVIVWERESLRIQGVLWGLLFIWSLLLGVAWLSLQSASIPWRAWLLAFVDGLSHSAIAEQLGVPLGTVKSRIRLACQRIRQSLGDLQ